jgi:hypothetical protein
MTDEDWPMPPPMELLAAIGEMDWMMEPRDPHAVGDPELNIDKELKLMQDAISPVSMSGSPDITMIQASNSSSPLIDPPLGITGDHELDTNKMTTLTQDAMTLLSMTRPPDITMTYVSPSSSPLPDPPTCTELTMLNVDT